MVSKGLTRAEIQGGDVLQALQGQPRVIELPTPKTWPINAGYPIAGKDIFTVYRNNNGTVLGFQADGSGFVHYNLGQIPFLTNPTILGEGSLFGQGGSGRNVLSFRQDGTAMLVEDDNQHFYSILQSDTAFNPFGVNHPAIYKFHVGASAANSFGNGYFAVDAVIDGNLFTPAMPITASNRIAYWKFFKSGGIRYLCFIQDLVAYVVNMDTMTFVGSWTTAAGNVPLGIFVDSGNILNANPAVWLGWTNGAATNNIVWILWNNAAGTTGTNLNGTAVFSSITINGENGADFNAFIPSFKHNGVTPSGILFGNADGIDKTHNGGSLFSLDALGGTFIAIKGNDAKLFYSGTFDAPQSAFDVGEQPDNTFAVPGDVGDALSSTQDGGVLNIVDANTLNLKKSYNITQIINNSGQRDRIARVNISSNGPNCLPPIANMRYDSVTNSVLVTYEFLGSPVYLVLFGSII